MMANKSSILNQLIAASLSSALALAPLGCKSRTGSPNASETASADDQPIGALPLTAQEPARALQNMVQGTFKTLGYSMIDAQGNQVSDKDMENEPEKSYFIAMPKAADAKFPKFVLQMKLVAAEDSGDRKRVDVNLVAYRASENGGKIIPNTEADGEIGFTSFVIDPEAPSSENSVGQQLNAFDRAVKEMGNKIGEVVQADATVSPNLFGKRMALGDEGQAAPEIARIKEYIMVAVAVAVVMGIGRSILSALIAEVAVGTLKFAVKSPLYILRLFGPKGKIIASTVMIGGLVYAAYLIKQRYITKPNEEAVRQIGIGIVSIK